MSPILIRHLALALLFAALGSSCQMTDPDALEPDGPPHPSNLTAAATTTRANAQHLMDDAVVEGLNLRELNRQLKPKPKGVEFDPRIMNPPLLQHLNNLPAPRR